MTDITALTIAVTALYSTGHWIGATILAAWLAVGLYSQVDDPLGTKAYFSALRRARSE
jgi:hypothetical protein